MTSTKIPNIASTFKNRPILVRLAVVKVPHSLPHVCGKKSFYIMGILMYIKELSQSSIFLCPMTLYEY